MAKVTIVFSDKRNGQVNVAIDFDPPINKRKPTPTQAQIAAAKVLAVLQSEHPEEFEEGLERAE